MLLDGSSLTCAQVFAIACDQAPLLIGSLDRAREAWRTAHTLTGAVYGQTTGVGANKDMEVPAGGLDLLRSHAGGAGPLIEPERARAMLVVRLNQLLAGGSGVNPRLLPVLAAAINSGFTPPVRQYGAIGTGDLTALASTALCLLGELPWRTGESPDVPRFELESSDALPFISSGAATASSQWGYGCPSRERSVRATSPAVAVRYSPTSRPVAGSVERKVAPAPSRHWPLM